MKHLLAFLLLLGALNAQAQPVQQAGTVTIGHGARWAGDGVLADAGTAADPLATSLGASPGPICVNSGPLTGPYNAFCMQVSVTGATLTVDNIGGATGGFSIIANGVTQGFTTVSLPSITDRPACWSNTTGNLTNCAAGGVTSLGGSSGVITLGSGLSIASNILSNTGVLSFGAATGAITVSTGLTMTGNAVSNTGVLSFGAATGAITVSTGLTMTGNALSNTGVLSFGGSTGAITVSTGLTFAANALSNAGVTSFGAATGAITVSTGLTMTGNALSNTGVLTLGGLAGTFTCTSTTGVICSGNAIALNLTAFIPALTLKAVPDPDLDFVILYDAAGVATKKVTPGSIALSVVAGVTSLGGETGVLTCGTGLTCAASDVSVNLTPVFSALATKVTPVTADYVTIYDVAGTAAKRSLISTLPVVRTFGGSDGAITVGAGLTFAANALSNAGVTSFGAATGAITVSTGLTMTGNALSNTGVLTFGGSAGAITVSTGLTFAANALSNAGVLSLGAVTGTITLGTGLTMAASVLKPTDMATSTIKCRTTAGTGTPEDCTAAQAAAIIAVPGGAVKSAVINDTFDLATASGSFTITGFGFNPTAVSVNFSIIGGFGSGSGYMSGGTQSVITYTTDQGIGNVRFTSLIYITNNASTVSQICNGSFIADGISLACVKGGSPTGTLYISVLGIR